MVEATVAPMRFFNYSFGDEARQRGDGQCICIGPAGVTETGALRALMEQEVIGKKASIDRQAEQPGDVPQTWADVSKAKELLGYEPTTSFKEGVAAFYDWWSKSSF